ncbi:MAG: hypothetical protein LBM17_00320 [Candidatus Accumulibacter sp.]|jgi:uncharacterized ion transporter superfamily protein YfcC|nr:hypothetical protein [Accumulibacter sp.]
MTFLEGYFYHFSGTLFLLAGIVFVYFIYRNDIKRNKRSFLSYTALWPIVFEDYRKNRSKNSDTFVIVGLLIMLLLVVGAVWMDRK